MRGTPPEKLNCPYAVVRFDRQWFDAEKPSQAITVVSIFDERERAEADVERLNHMKADSESVYFVQRVKKYYRKDDG